MEVLLDEGESLDQVNAHVLVERIRRDGWQWPTM